MYIVLSLAVVLFFAILVPLNDVWTRAGRRSGPGVLLFVAGLLGFGGFLFLGLPAHTPEDRGPGQGFGYFIVQFSWLPFDAMSLSAGAYYWRQLRPRRALPLLFAIGVPVYALVWPYL